VGRVVDRSDELARGGPATDPGRRGCGVAAAGREYGGAMRCPYCATDDDKVVDSRPADDGGAVRRRRECLACGRRFTTYERFEDVTLVVTKRSGIVEPFDPAKVRAGIDRAVAGSGIDPAAVDALAAGIEEEVRALGPEVPSEAIGLAVLERLRALDLVSYMRYASVYKGFDDVADFERELVELQKQTEPKPRHRDRRGAGGVR
jgi:transcriptional repressor NrdR